MRIRTTIAALALVAVSGACATHDTDSPDPDAVIATTGAADAAAHRAHDAYVAAINSNNVDSMLAMVTDDVVFMAPDAPPFIGRDALRPWLEGYVAAFDTRWDKPVQEFVVNGDWAWERYAYSHVDTPKAGGDPVKGSGWGLIIYQRGADGVWRVARDSWGSDQPVMP
jgi:ketosteroid isomerase-like protein